MWETDCRGQGGTAGTPVTIQVTDDGVSDQAGGSRDAEKWSDLGCFEPKMWSQEASMLVPRMGLRVHLPTFAALSPVFPPIEILCRQVIFWLPGMVGTY